MIAQPGNLISYSIINVWTDKYQGENDISCYLQYYGFFFFFFLWNAFLIWKNKYGFSRSWSFTKQISNFSACEMCMNDWMWAANIFQVRMHFCSKHTVEISRMGQLFEFQIFPPKKLLLWCNLANDYVVSRVMKTVTNQ